MKAGGNGLNKFFQCALLGALLVSAGGIGPAAAARAAPTAQQIAEYEATDEASRVRLLIQLAKTGQHELALELLHRYPLQGPHAQNRTLFIQGLVLRAEGDLTGATKKFRAALARDPSLTMVRAELAQTLVALEQDDSAKHHLELLAAEAPSSQEAAGIRAFVDKIDERSPYKFNFYLAAAPTTNVNSGSSHSTVYSPIFNSNLTISDDSRKSSGIGGIIGGNAAFNKRLGNDFSFVAAGNAEFRGYDNSDFNSLSLSQSAEMRYMFERGYVGLGAVASQNIDEEALELGYVSYGPRLSTRINLGARDFVTASSVYEWRDAKGSSAADGTAWMSDVALTHALGAASNVTVSAGYDDVEQELAQNSYQSWSGGLSFYKELPLGVTANLMGEVKYSEFDALNIIVGKVREDVRYVGGLALTKRDLDLWGFAPEVSYTYVLNTSNVTLYDYDSHSVDFRLTKEF